MLKILIADDDELVLRLIQTLIKPFEFTIFTAQNGRDAWSIVQKENPDIILTDIEMPHLNGFELCKRVKGDKALAQNDCQSESQ